MKKRSIPDTLLTNSDFLNVIYNSFCDFISSGTSRSTAKLKPLHGAIAKDLSLRLGPGYSVHSQGFADGKEARIKGRYIDKEVDITVKRDAKPIAGLSVKFVMQNYSQNSNNYFENMLGETANIRCNNYPYFQIFITLDKIPYYRKGGEFSKWETFSPHNAAKYLALSNDDPSIYPHTPNKTLLFIVHIPECDRPISRKADYLFHYRTSECEVSISHRTYPDIGSSVIINDYETFMNKVYHTILSL